MSPWRTWLFVLIGLAVGFSGSLYVAVIAIDPMSTGRFALTQRIDFASPNPRLAKAGLVRDPQFDGAIIGSSTAVPLDPEVIAAGTKWRIAQLALVAALPPNQLTVARAFARHHRPGPALTVFVLDKLWCRPGPVDQGAWGPFPAWLYDGSSIEYLSRIFFPAAIEAAAARLRIWLGRQAQSLREDGYAPQFQRQNRAALTDLHPPTDGEAPEAPFPALDLLAMHLATLPADWPAVFVFAPVFSQELPAAGSAAAARVQACKRRVAEIAAQRRNGGYLDLMIDDPVVRDIDNFFDVDHYGENVARWVEARMAAALPDSDRH